ncbi:MAG: hypothetical protein D6785_06290 [Planctomycetota bacterium]|nr:MAG: hypothetical protein D6785_06290 [Planctomycetota bacterium]
MNWNDYWNNLENLYQAIHPEKEETLHAFMEALMEKKPFPLEWVLDEIGLSDWMDWEEDVYQEFFAKIYSLLMSGRFAWEPEKGSLKAYLRTIFARLVIDMGRKLSHMQQEIHDTELLAKIEEKKKVQPNEENPAPPSLELKSEYKRKVEGLPILQRLLVKLWKPYLFEYTFNPYEQKWIEERSGMDFPTFLKMLKEEMDEMIHLNKPYISPEFIYRTLHFASRNYVDVELSRIRRHMPWLVNLENALEDEVQ